MQQRPSTSARPPSPVVKTAHARTHASKEGNVEQPVCKKEKSQNDLSSTAFLSATKSSFLRQPATYDGDQPFSRSRIVRSLAAVPELALWAIT